ncbi:tRNA (adenosine(37)-N6)-threonylcarbamoyltransferase complex transferase subunit TsaD [Patescibacteria group bacterium]|nr:tRNA (adenosine(37)-N6)-threonylcarbamoyltransferase complex transferase subunit TsaD [Patescibacteria group bacterium]
MIVLGLETSCDETSWALLKVTKKKLEQLSLTISSQTKLHARWGGVVPELAARRHNQTILPLLQTTLQQAGLKPQQINLVAVTQGPGLITALTVGTQTAKALSFVWQKPLLGINHIAGHLISPFLNPKVWPTAFTKTTWPAVALVVSGGHTELYLMSSLTKYKLLGKTLDDASGEAFDKTAKMLNLAYPGGPKVSKLAQTGNPTTYNFPRPMLQHAGYNFSFAGLKTAVLYSLKKIKKPLNLKTKADICSSFEQAVIDVLVNKSLKAIKQYSARSLLVSGGVSANQKLRQALANSLQKNQLPVKLLLPELNFTGDNASMIALAGAVATDFKPAQKLKNNWQKLQANANWELWN